MKKKISLLLFIIVDISILLAVIFITFSSTKDYYTVEFNLNGGVLLSGDLKQTVKFGSKAIPPQVVKDGEKFLEWSDDYHNITEDKVIYAIWDFETTFGIQFDVYYDGNYCLISGSYNDISGDVYISAYYNERRVIGVKDNAFTERKRMTSISLPSGIYSIGKQSFKGCSSLSSIMLPDTLINIDEEAFAGCKSLTEIVLPETIISIGKNAFSDCTGLNVITLGPNVEEISGESFNNMESLESIIVSEDNPYFTSIDGNLYSKDGKVLIKYASGKTDEVFSIPDSVEVISDYAFENAKNLKKINISNNLYNIEPNGIYQCDNIEYNVLDGIKYLGNEENPYQILLSVIELTQTEIVLPEGVKVIYDEAFKDCTDLVSVDISYGLKLLGDSAFYGCLNLQTIKLPSSIISIGDNAFYSCESLVDLKLPDYLQTIGTYAFYSCISLEEIAIPNSVISVDEHAFDNCTGLITAKLSSQMDKISRSLFYDCSGLKSVIIPDSIKTIENSAFRNCISLQKVILPNSVESIGSSAFYNCAKLTEIYIPSSVKSVGMNIIYGCPMVTIMCQAESKPSSWHLRWASGYRSIKWNVEFPGKDL